MQVTNRDLSTLVLRRFLPLLKADREAGALKKQRPKHKTSSGHGPPAAAAAAAALQGTSGQAVAAADPVWYGSSMDVASFFLDVILVI